MRPFNPARQLPCLCRLFFCAVVFFGASFVFAQSASEYGEAAIAAKYLQWVQQQCADGHYKEAEKALIRAGDYASFSSDLSYLYAEVQIVLSRPRRQILASLNLAIATDRWNYYTDSDARLLKTKILLALMYYDEALAETERLPASEKKEEIRLFALSQLRNNEIFRLNAEKALYVYPKNRDIISLVFNYAARLETIEPQDYILISRLLKQINSLLEIDEDLIFTIAPFMPDIEEAARLLQSRRASSVNGSPKDALPVLLNLGVINEDTAIEELFSPQEERVQKNGVLPANFALPPSFAGNSSFIDKKDLLSVFKLLRTDRAREQFLGRLAYYNGLIAQDHNNDGIFELIGEYQSGLPCTIINDRDQDGRANLTVNCMAGLPVNAFIYTDEADDGFETGIVPSITPDFNYMRLDYEVYPSVKTAFFHGSSYFFRPEDFYYEPFHFEELCSQGGTVFPEINPEEDIPGERSLFSFAYIIERPSREFKGGIESIRLLDGIILQARETLDGKTVSETEFVSGRPRFQKIDSDRDGRMETIRHFKQNIEGNTLQSGGYYFTEIMPIEYIESDWDGDGNYEKQ
ncbi:MAG: hypothetical protein LBV68_01580 [Spirochaetaceae bacterium]|jgi:hypothetical protein|nr:hypothetical protein [Spirochaetaceae bacterium]